MTRALVVTRLLPTQPDQVHGIYGRLDMFMSALLQEFDEIEYLCLRPSGQAPDLNFEVVQNQLRSRWSERLELSIAEVSPQLRPTKLIAFVRGFFQKQYSHHGAGVLLSRSSKEAIQEALKRGPRLVFAHRLPCLIALQAALKESDGTPAIVCDLDDIEHIAYARRLRYSPAWPNERYWLAHLPNLFLTECNAIRKTDVSFVCSDEDARYLNKVSNTTTAKVIPNSVVPLEVVDGSDEEIVLFVGTFGYRPNAAAAEELVKNIWPQVHEMLPNAELYLVGKQSELVNGRDITAPGVRWKGFVEDLAPLYQQARVVCCPIRFGSGTRIKIIEAALAGKAIVSTNLGAEGLDFQDEEEIVLRNSRNDIISAVVELLGNPERARRIGSAAKRKAEEQYVRERIVQRTRNHIKTLSNDNHQIGSVSNTSKLG